jgi:hypothetical protein
MAVTFLATIAMLQSAIQISGDGGCRIKLDIDDSGMDAVMALSAMRGELLQVTVEVTSVKQMQTDGESMETRAKRKPRWTTTEAPHNDADAGASGRAHGRNAGRCENVRQAVVSAGSLGAADHAENDAS